jgi:hypothetical protein
MKSEKGGDPRPPIFTEVERERRRTYTTVSGTVDARRRITLDHGDDVLGGVEGEGFDVQWGTIKGRSATSSTQQAE